MKSKRPKNRRPDSFPMEFVRNGKIEKVNVPLEDYIPVVPFLEIGPPGCLKDQFHSGGLKTGECKVVPYPVTGVRDEEYQLKILKKYGAEELRVPFQLDVGAFLRMMAKIGLCHAVFRYGLGHFEEIYVTPAILGKTQDVSKWVGSDGLPVIFRTERNFNNTHIVACGRHESTEVRVRIKIWNKSQTPEYIVVVGRLNERAAAVLDLLTSK